LRVAVGFDRLSHRISLKKLKRLKLLKRLKGIGIKGIRRNSVAEPVEAHRNSQLSTLNSQLSTLNSQLSTLNSISE
jgi:hypothetical protein